MFLPHKYQQKNTQNQDVSFNNYMAFSRKYFKMMKNKKNTKVNAKNELDFELKIDQNVVHSNVESSSSQKTDILKWLFSLSKTDRMKAVTIENKWITSMICQMYISIKKQSNLIFKLRIDDSDEGSSPYTVNTSSLNLNPLIQISPYYFVENYYVKKPENFSLQSFEGNQTTRNKYENNVLEKLLLLNLVERHENDSIMLHSDFIEDKYTFESVFNSITEQKFLQYSISVNLDNDNKSFIWSLPDWFDIKVYNSPAKIYTAFLDQTLVIRYNLFMQEREKFRFSLMDTKLDDFLDQREVLINFLAKEAKKKSKDKTFAKLNVKDIVTDVYKEEKTVENGGYTTFYGIACRYQTHSQDPISDYYERLRSRFIEFTETEFMDYLTCATLRQDVTSFDNTLKEKILGAIYNLYTDQNALELLEWEDTDTKTEKGKKKNKKHLIKDSKEKQQVSPTKLKDNSDFNSQPTTDMSNASKSIFFDRSKADGYRLDIYNIKEGLNQLIKENIPSHEKTEQSCKELLQKKFRHKVTEKGDEKPLNTLNSINTNDKDNQLFSDYGCIKLDEIDFILNKKKDDEDIEMGKFKSEEKNYLKMAKNTAGSGSKENRDIYNNSQSKNEGMFKGMVINTKNTVAKNSGEDKIINDISFFKECLKSKTQLNKEEIRMKLTSKKSAPTSSLQVVSDHSDTSSEYIDCFVKTMLDDLITKLEDEAPEDEEKLTNKVEDVSCEVISPGKVVDKFTPNKPGEKTLEETIQMLQTPTIDTNLILQGGKKKNKKKKHNNNQNYGNNLSNLINQKQFLESKTHQEIKPTSNQASANPLSTSTFSNMEATGPKAKYPQKSTISNILDKLDRKTPEKIIESEKTEGAEREASPQLKIKKKTKNYINDYCNKTTSDESINRSINETYKDETNVSKSETINKNTENGQMKPADAFNLNYFLHQQELAQRAKTETQTPFQLPANEIDLSSNRKISNVSNLSKNSYLNLDGTSSPIKLKNYLSTKENCCQTEPHEFYPVQNSRKESINSQVSAFSGPFERFTNLNSFNYPQNEYIGLQSNYQIKQENVQMNPMHQMNPKRSQKKKSSQNSQTPATAIINNSKNPQKSNFQSGNSNNLVNTNNQFRCVGAKNDTSKRNSFNNKEIKENQVTKLNETQKTKESKDMNSKKDLRIDVNNANNAKPGKANSTNNHKKNHKSFTDCLKVNTQKFRNLNNEFHDMRSPTQMYNPNSAIPGNQFFGENSGQVQNNFFIINSNVNIGNFQKPHQVNNNSFNYMNSMNSMNSGQFSTSSYHQQGLMFNQNQMFDMQNNNLSNGNYYYQPMMHMSPTSMTSPTSINNMNNMCTMNMNYGQIAPYSIFNKDMMNTGMSGNMNMDYCNMNKLGSFNMYQQHSQMLPNNYFCGNYESSRVVPGSGSVPNNSLPNQTSSITLLKKIETKIYPFTFHYKLHNDILDYTEKVTEILGLLKPFKMSILEKLKEIIKKSFADENIELDVYGSFATSLSIESSDIDLTLRVTDFYDVETTINILSDDLKKEQVFDSIHPITTASVPVIKLLIDPLKILTGEEKTNYLKFKSSDNYTSYPFDKDDLDKVKIDISFFENSGSRSNSKLAVDYINGSMLLYPEIKPLVFVLKRLLNLNNLNLSFNGGLSSYSLFIMVLAYLKYPKPQPKLNLGRMLIEFLEYFGKSLKFNSTIIDCNSINPIMIVSNETYDSFPIIIDPINANHNVAKQSYRIEEVKKLFSNAHDFFSKLKISFDKKDLTNESNSVFNILLSKLIN